MPVTKKVFLRYQIIHACLSSRVQRYWAGDEIIEKFAAYDLDVDVRTLERDFYMMRTSDQLGYFAPIAYCARNRGYYYTDPDFSINTFTFTLEDLDVLKKSSALLKRYRGTQVFDAFESVLKKLSGFLKQDTEVSIVQEESPVYCSGLEHYDTVLHAIHEQRVLSITLNRFNKQPVVLHPYFLKQVKGSWHVAGYIHDTIIPVISVQLKHIAQIEDTVLPYEPNIMLNRENYFRHTYGGQPGLGDPEEITLWWRKSMLFLIRSSPLHTSQRLGADAANDGVLVHVTLVYTEEFMETLVSYGEAVDVLKPEWLREEWVGNIAWAEREVKRMRGDVKEG
ncbi:MAG TPA: WYL domain-containing protein [Ohtaekwangia sp.]